MNPANYKGFTDPNGGEWIELRGTKWKGVVWRPINMEMSEDGNLSYAIELFEGPGIPSVEEADWDKFGTACGNIITDILAAEAAELQQIAAEAIAEESPEEVQEEVVEEKKSSIILPGQF
jgi:hypothetical protein